MADRGNRKVIPMLCLEHRGAAHTRYFLAGRKGNLLDPSQTEGLFYLVQYCWIGRKSIPLGVLGKVINPTVLGTAQPPRP